MCLLELGHADDLPESGPPPRPGKTVRDVTSGAKRTPTRGLLARTVPRRLSLCLGRPSEGPGGVMKRFAFGLAICAAALGCGGSSTNPALSRTFSYNSGSSG